MADEAPGGGAEQAPVDTSALLQNAIAAMQAAEKQQLAEAAGKPAPPAAAPVQAPVVAPPPVAAPAAAAAPVTPAPASPVAAAAAAEVARREAGELAKLQAEIDRLKPAAEKAKQWEDAQRRAKLAPEAVIATLGVDDKTLDQWAKRHLLRRLGEAAPQNLRDEAAQLEAVSQVAQIEQRIEDRLSERDKVIADLQAQIKTRDEADARRQAEAQATALIARATAGVTDQHKHLQAFAKSKPEMLDAAVRQAAATLYQETGAMPEAAAVIERAEKTLAEQFAPLLAILQPQQSQKAEPQQPAITLGAGTHARQPLVGAPPDTASPEERMKWALGELQAGRLLP